MLKLWTKNTMFNLPDYDILLAHVFIYCYYDERSRKHRDTDVSHYTSNLFKINFVTLGYQNLDFPQNSDKFA